MRTSRNINAAIVFSLSRKQKTKSKIRLRESLEIISKNQKQRNGITDVWKDIAR